MPSARMTKQPTLRHDVAQLDNQILPAVLVLRTFWVHHLQPVGLI